MSNPAAPSGGNYNEALRDAQGTVNLAYGIYNDLVRRPLSSAWTAREARKALRKGLGEWAPEAFDADDKCLQPVLRRDAFEKHLIDNQAAFRPSGSCSASFAWAKLLYSLDIRPGAGIIEWISLGSDGTNSATIDLELEGPVLCHIINLYQIYKTPYGTPLQNLHDWGAVWQFNFGTFTIHPGPNGSAEPRSWNATFKPHADQVLAQPREPFVAHYHGNYPDRLLFSNDSTAIKYISTVTNTWNCSDGALRLPNPTEPLGTRCFRLYECIEAIESHQLRLGRTPPYLVTPSWIEQASRIKRRLTTNGGANDCLAEHMVKFIATNDTERKKRFFDDDLGDPGLHRDMRWETAVRKDVEELCFYEGENFEFTFVVNRGSQKRHAESRIGPYLPEALESFGQRSPGELLSPSGDSIVHQVVRILKTRIFYQRPVLVMALTPGHTLWESPCYVKGQVPGH
ncbi:hypothetical protein F4777DRAFT_553982 [Nemania sp. FL0916]|nr:hypothetical protein F4777DRAFT_553982 [Nemania sp. FL0916]